MTAFNENEYKREWRKENMKVVRGTYKNEFVDEFKEACKKLGITQSEVIRQAMEKTIQKAKKHQKD